MLIEFARGWYHQVPEFGLKLADAAFSTPLAIFGRVPAAVIVLIL